MRNSGIELSHPCPNRSSTRLQDVTNDNVSEGSGVDARLLHHGSQDGSEQVISSGAFEGAAFSLAKGRAEGRDDHDIAVAKAGAGRLGGGRMHREGGEGGWLS